MRTRTSRSRSRALGVLAALALAVGILVPVAAAEPAVAADGANFDAGMIISDETFYNSAAMNEGQIQAFLNQKGASCSPNSLPCVKDITLSYAARGGDQYCGTLPAATNVRAAAMLVAVSIACGINPQVLLVLVEKEQSLVSRSSPSDYSYRYATGFACPDSPPGCDDALSGFVTQVYLAAKQFNRYKINPGSYNFQAGRVNNILYNPNPACGASGVFIRNQATAGLYNYTPYQPNASALANLYGSGDACGSYGNRNFWRMFTDWFGSDTNLLSAASFESSVSGWAFGGGIARNLAGPTTAAKSGSYYLSAYAPSAGLSIAQDASVNIQVRDTFVATMWVKTGSPGVPYTGTLAVWALGGQTEAATQPFTVGDAWTQVSVSLPILRSGHTAIRFEVYLQSTNALFAMDAASLMKTTGQAPRNTVTLSSPGAEQGVGSWAVKTGSVSLGTSTTQPIAGTQSLQASGTGSVGQDVSVPGVAGDSYTTTIWLRANEGTVKGAIALWALGSTAETTTTNFTVGTSWTPVVATVTVGQAVMSTLRLEVYFESGTLFIDEATIYPNLVANPSFEASSPLWNNGITQNVMQRIVGSAGAPQIEGAWLAVTSGFNGGSIATDVKRRTVAGETYTATLWLRSATPGQNWTGAVALWALGGQSEVAVQDITVYEYWTAVRIDLPLSQPVHETLRLELYTSTPGVQLYLDSIKIR